MKLLKEKIIFGKGVLLIAVIILPMFACSQTCRHFTLDELVRSAYEKYPYANRLELIKEQSSESAKAIDAEWLTHVSASVKSSYQSEISSIDIPKDIENKFGINTDGGKKLQYQGGLSVSQLIYDGGVSSIKKE
jgi:hypothetical protein